MQSFFSTSNAFWAARPSSLGLAVVMRVFALAALLAATPSCGDPCRDLSDSVCNCMPSRLDQQACRKRVHNLAAQSGKLTSNERQICQNLLQSCTCEALAQGDFSACGLAQD